MTFITRLDLVPLPDGSRWYLDEPLTWYGSIDGRTWRVEVPERFVTDGASVPRLLWAFASPWGKHGRAAVLHDRLYWEQNVTRAEADRVFRDVMAECGQLLLVRWAMWSAVRVFGYFAWHGNAADKARGVTRILPKDGVPGPNDVAPKRGIDRIVSVLCRRFCGAAA